MSPSTSSSSSSTSTITSCSICNHASAPSSNSSSFSFAGGELSFFTAGGGDDIVDCCRIGATLLAISLANPVLLAVSSSFIFIFINISAEADLLALLSGGTRSTVGDISVSAAVASLLSSNTRAPSLFVSTNFSFSCCEEANEASIVEVALVVFTAVRSTGGSVLDASTDSGTSISSDVSPKAMVPATPKPTAAINAGEAPEKLLSSVPVSVPVPFALLAALPSLASFAFSNARRCFSSFSRLALSKASCFCFLSCSAFSRFCFSCANANSCCSCFNFVALSCSSCRIFRSASYFFSFMFMISSGLSRNFCNSSFPFSIFSRYDCDGSSGNIAIALLCTTFNRISPGS
mmetsp:Transcript_16714/g.26084  ORF Transcript_16714/g.26084 Transcript_16714/m.26084 type:complete len:348 (-) Transcript_16714:1018-2061(-)